MNPDFPAAWMTYVNVDSADDTIAKVKANGGAVFVEPMDVMDVGRMAIFADPAGAVLGPVAARVAHRRAAGQRARHVVLERAHHDRRRRRRRPSTAPCSAGAPRTRARAADHAYTEWKVGTARSAA